MWEERIGDRCKEARGESTNPSAARSSGWAGSWRKEGQQLAPHFLFLDKISTSQYLHVARKSGLGSRGPLCWCKCSAQFDRRCDLVRAMERGLPEFEKQTSRQQARNPNLSPGPPPGISLHPLLSSIHHPKLENGQKAQQRNPARNYARAPEAP